MLAHGKLYQKVNDDRWMQISELPELFNEIQVSDTNDQIVVADMMQNWVIDHIKSSQIRPIQPLRFERLLSPDLIIIIASFTNQEGRDARLVVWGKSEVTLVRKGDKTNWEDVRSATNLQMP